MCEQCCAKADGYGEFIPGYYLCRANQDGHYMKKGDWGIVITNDPSFFFHTTPIKDPFHGMSDEQAEAIPLGDPIHQQWRNFYDTANTILNEMLESLRDEIDNKRNGRRGGNLLSHYGNLFRAMLAAGYDPERDGYDALWLCHRIAEHIEANLKPIYPFDGGSAENNDVT